jgi:hypothetical protein
MSTTVRLLVEVTDGKPVHEEVHVEDRGAGTYRLLQSPGFVAGLAADDVFLLEPDGSFKLLQRGGNIAIQMFSDHPLDRVEPFVSSDLTEIDGRLDGKLPNLLVYTVSAKVGFPDIERLLQGVIAKFPLIRWYYGNVYDPVDDVTPLNWWLEP